MSGPYPEELVFDSTLTTVASMAELHRRKIRFLTLRAKKPAVIRQLQRHRRFINTWAEVRVDASTVRVLLPRRSHTPLLLEAGHDKLSGPVPWRGGRTLHFGFR